MLRHAALAAGAIAALVTAGCASGHSTKPASQSTSSPSAPSTSLPATASACVPATGAPANASGKEVSPPGDIPDNQAFVTYAAPDASYTVKVPEGWARTDASSAVTFTDKFNSVRVEVIDATQGPTVQSAQAQDVPALSASTHCLANPKVSNVTRRAGAAVLITYEADGPPDSVTGKVVRDDVERYEFWRSGRLAILTLSGAAGSDNVDPWRLVSDSFAWH